MCIASQSITARIKNIPTHWVEMSFSGEFESIVKEVRSILGDALVSMRLFTTDGVILYSDSKDSLNEDFIVASGSAMVEISRSFSMQLGLGEEPVVILIGGGVFIVIRRVQKDVIIMMSIKGSQAQLSEEVAEALSRIKEFLA